MAATLVIACVWALGTPPSVARADESAEYVAGVACVPGSCEAVAKSVIRKHGAPASKRHQIAKRPVRAGEGGRKGKSKPTGLLVPRATGWEYGLLGGMGILPWFDARLAKKPKSGGGKKASVEVVVQRAIERLTLPEPVIRTSPDEDLAQVVHVPTWMWVERSRWRPVTASAAVDGVRVTATARPRRAVWSMGDGGQVVCRGPGTPYSAAYASTASSPDCGYTYRLASMTAPRQVYKVTVSVSWDVEWRGGGRSGVVPDLETVDERQLVVDEVQTVVTR